MSEALALGLALVAGIALGVVFFGGLWITVRRLPEAANPALLTLGSFLGRTAFVLLGFYFVMGGHWERLALCLVGFVSARFVVVRRLGKDVQVGGDQS